MPDPAENDKNIQIWKVKRLIKGLESLRGNVTSMISLIIPHGDQISRVTRMLDKEYETVSNIKSTVYDQSVFDHLDTVTSAQKILRQCNEVSPNGLIIYCGTIRTEDRKEKNVTIKLEPFKPINASLYLCDNKFYPGPLGELLESDDKFGFIIIDRRGTLFATLSGNTTEVLHEFPPDRDRLLEEEQYILVRKTAELATQIFINAATSQPNVSGLILAGIPNLVSWLGQSDVIDPRLETKILNVVPLSYGGRHGFSLAIHRSAEILPNVKFIQVNNLIHKLFMEISHETGKYVVGVDETIKALELGAVETLLVWEDLDLNRYEL